MKKLTVLGQDLNVQISPSFLQKAACPLALKIRYIDRYRDQYIRVASLRGSAGHEAIAELTTEFLANKEMKLRDFTDERIHQAVAKHTPHEVYSELGHIYQWVKIWRDRFHFDRATFYGHEERMSIDHNFDECSWDTADYRGIIDQINIKDQFCTITDYKSQMAILNQEELDTHDQLTFYAWLTSKFYPHVKVFFVRIWYLRYGFYHETVRTRAQLDDFEKVLAMREQKVLDITEWRPIPGAHCDNCDYVHLCPIAKDASDLPVQIITEEQAVKVALRLRVVESLKKTLQTRLREYSKGTSLPVQIEGDYIYEYVYAPKTFYDTQALEKLLRDNGIEFAPLVNVDKKKLKKLVKEHKREHPELADEIEATLVVKHATKFMGHELGKDANPDEPPDEG